MGVDTDTEKAQEVFEKIRRIFFPRWDRKGNWSIQIDPSLPRDGDADSSREKTITLRSVPDDSHKSWSLVIHEICHAFGGGLHAGAWKRRMLLAATRAEELGRPSLSKLLQDEVKAYNPENSERISTAMVDGYIRDCAFDQPNTDDDSILTFVAHAVGLSVAELETQYPRSRQVCLKALQEARRARRV